MPESRPSDDQRRLALSEKAPQAHTVLCVDDQETNRYLRSHALRSAGFQVVEACDGASALRIAGELHPSLVLLDIRLPDVSGFEVCQKLKSDPRTTAIPVLHVSAVGQSENDLPASLENQSDAYLHEPIDPDALVATVKALIRARERRDESRATELRYRKLLESAWEGVCVLDPQGRTEFANRRLAEMLKCSSPEELLGRSAFDFFEEDQRETLKARFADYLKNNRRERYEARMRCTDGSLIWASISGSNLQDEGGPTIGRMSLVTDITEQKRTEEALRASEYQFRTLANSIPQLCWMANGDGWIFWYNQRWYEYTGTTPEQMEGWGWQSVHDPRVLPEVLERWKSSIARAVPFEMVFPLRGADGVFRPFLTRIIPMRGPGGEILRWIGTNTDISEERRTEEALKRQAELLKLSFDAIFSFQLDGVIESWNVGAERVYGISEAEAMGRVSHELLDTKFPKPWPEVRADLLEHGSWEGELGHRRSDGRRIIVSSRQQLIRNPDGTGRVLEINRDITELKRGQDALRASEELLRQRVEELETLMQLAPAAIFVAHDPQCTRITANRMGSELLEQKPDGNLSADAPNARVRFFRAGQELRSEELPMQAAAAQGKEVRGAELEILLPSGKRIAIMGHASPLRDAGGQVRGCLGAFLDITEHKKSEERLRQTQKLESIGLLAGGIAHDFNNLLTGILGNASLVLSEVEPDTARRITEIIKGAERAAHLTRQLLAYSGKGQFITREIDISQAVTEIADLVQFSIPKSVELAITVQRRLPAVRMDPGQLQQVLMNLVINAGEAIGEGQPGRVRIATSLKDVGQKFVDAIGTEVQPGRYICVEVTDTGSGIDEDKQSKIFEPFFTTKFTGRGLGLAAVAGILRAQGGALTLDSDPGRGTTFRVFLPAAHDEAAGSMEDAGAGGRGTILVVDDEATVRKFIGSALSRQGYRVLLAADGKEALAQCEREEREIAAAVVDIVMPIMGANDLLPTLKAQRPHTRILLTSGYSESEARHLCAAYPGAVFIQKPYTAQQILGAVEKLLDVRR